MKTYSQGSLRERSKGRWQARFCVTMNGTSKIVSRSFEATSPRAAREKMMEIRRELEEAGINNQSETNLVDYMHAYIADRTDAGLIEPSTASNYRSSVKHIARYMSDYAIGDVTPDSILSMQAGLLREGLVADTVAKDHRFLKQVMAYAVDMGHIVKTPFNRSVKPPHRGKPMPNALDEDSKATLLQMLNTSPVSRLSIAIKLAVFASMRREEACGLRWEDVNFDAKTLSLSNAIGVADNKTYLKGTKTQSGERTVPLEQSLCDDLLFWAENHAEKKNGIPVGFVLGSGEKYYSPILLTKDFSALSRALGLKGVTGKRATFHDLRDTFATQLIEKGVSVRVVADLLGHSDPSMTLKVYTSSTAFGMGTAVNAIGELASQATA